MEVDRLALIRQKNAAYQRLEEADHHIDRRRHTAGSVPEAWLERRDELAREYEEAQARVWVARRRMGVKRWR